MHVSARSPAAALIVVDVLSLHEVRVVPPRADLKHFFADRWPRFRHAAPFIAAGAVVGSALGALSIDFPALALVGAFGVVLVGLCFLDLKALPIAAVPGTLVVIRAGAGGGISVSDLVLFVATLAALTMVVFSLTPELWGLLWLVVIYQATTALTVVYNPYRANLIEWFHELFIVAGGLLCGWVVGFRNSARTAFRAYLAMCIGLSGWAVAATIAAGFAPPYLGFGMQKNFVGAMLCFGVIIAYACPDWLGWNPRLCTPLICVFLIGMLAAQSRSAIVSGFVGLVAVSVRRRYVGKRSRIVMLAIVPLLVFAYEVLRNQISSDNRFNSFQQRLDWFAGSIQIWHTSPWFGVGLRWWYSGRFAVAFQPPNGEIEMISSAGVIGLAGFLTLMIGSLYLLWRVDPRFGTLAFAIVLMRVTQGQLDLFWVGGSGTLPWLVAGICLGALSAERNGTLREFRPRRYPLDARSTLRAVLAPSNN